MTRNLDARLNPHSQTVLSLFRVVFGLLFALHGSAILFAWPIAMGPTAPTGAWPLWWAGIIELVTGLLVTVGLFTRIAAFVASGAMAFAYFTQHLPHGFSPYLPPSATAASPRSCTASGSSFWYSPAAAPTPSTPAGAPAPWPPLAVVSAAGVAAAGSAAP